MKNLPLNPIDVSGLEVYANPFNVRRDLHIFVDYIRRRNVKRSRRQNDLPKADKNRLAKLLSDPDAAKTLKEYGEAPWIDAVDYLALQMGFIKYDTEGIYAGYTSYAPSYPDNYIEFQAQNYEKFLALSLAEQEHWILERLVNEGSNEFYSDSIVGQLDGFSTRGSATGVMPTLDFPEIRWFLLDILNHCQGGVWYSVASLVQYLKANHPYFLIPKNPKSQGSRWRKPEPVSRYGNFYESKKSRWDREIEIPDDAPDGFERVEGRYVERFLEGIPLLLQYVDVAYSKPKKKLYPLLNVLRAFRVSAHFLRLMSGQTAPPKVTILPNFEIHVEAAFYPVNTLRQLESLADLTADDQVAILKLNRKKVTARAAEDDTLDIPALLQALSGRELPKNVRREVEEWAGRSNAFTLYSGFGLFEGNAALPAGQEVEKIAPRLKIIRSPATVFAQLEKAEQVPLLIPHPADKLKAMPKGVRSRFRSQSAIAAAKPKKKKARLLLQRETAITLRFPSAKSLEAYRRAMIEARCPITVNQDNLSLTYSKRHQSLASQALKTMRQTYQIKIEDVV